MNSKIIFDFMRPKLGVTKTQFDALYRILDKVPIEDVAALLGMSEVEEKQEVGKSKFVLSKTSEDRLVGVDPTLVKVVRRALELSEYDFMVVEGLRTLETQKKYLAQGKTQTLKSYHLRGKAVDLAPLEDGKIDWQNKKGQFDAVAKAMLAAAKELGVKITWGGSWKTLVDKPHFQIEN